MLDYKFNTIKEDPHHYSKCSISFHQISTLNYILITLTYVIRYERDVTNFYLLLLLVSLNKIVRQVLI
jgi:hypothetical protein